MNKQQIIALLVGTLLGSLVSGGIVYYNLESKYFTIHKTNIGGFVFWQGKIFNLQEMKTIQD